MSCLLSQSLQRGKGRFIGASGFCFSGSSVAIFIYFDKTYLRSHDTETAAEEISLALRIQGG